MISPARLRLSGFGSPVNSLHFSANAADNRGTVTSSSSCSLGLVRTKLLKNPLFYHVYAVEAGLALWASRVDAHAV